MALLVDHLSIWDLGFRMEAKNPDRLWLFIPSSVKDSFRLLIDAILKGELLCLTLTLEKRHFEPEDKEFSIYHWLDDVYYCIQGISYNRKLLRWAKVTRSDFKQWCERMGAPLPEFWFPPGWKMEYDLPEGHLPPGYGFYRKDWTSEDWEAWQKEQDALEMSKANSDSMEEGASKLRANQEARIACQKIAQAIWEKDPTRTIASVVRDDLIQVYGGGGFFVDATVREWVKAVAPSDVKNRRGRPKNRSEDK